MAEVTKPIALDESFNTTEATPRNIADVLAAGLSSANELSDLDDVTINTSTLENRQGLIYNSTTDTWTNGTVATSIDCTQAQYDAWKSTGQLVVGTTYMIKDGQNVTCNLGDLDDVSISGSPSGKVLMNNGSAWVDSDIEYSDIKHRLVYEYYTKSFTPSTWVTPIYYADVVLATSKNIYSPTSIIVQSTSNQCWVVNSDKTGDKQITCRVACLTSATQSNIVFKIIYSTSD